MVERNQLPLVKKEAIRIIGKVMSEPQLYPYVIDKLVNWGKERGQNPKIPDTSAIMSPVAHSLNKSQIEAVAAYVSTLK